MPVGMNPVTKIIDGYNAPVNGVYWQGNDGNVWVKGSQGVNSAGAFDNNTDSYWTSRGFNKIADPNPPSTNTNITNNNNRSTVDWQNVGLYDQAIKNLQSSQGMLDQQRDIGLQNIAEGYRSNLDRLMNSKNLASQQYQKSQQDTTIDNQRARSNVDFETGQRANALQRLLGSKGAGSSSAARFAAPYAAALEGTQQLNQVGDTFTKNMGALDSNYNTYMRDWDQKNKDLEEQKINQERGVEADVATKRQSLLQKLAQAQAQRAQAVGGNPATAAQPFYDQANALNSQIADLGKQYYGRINVADPNYQAPDLSKYNYDARGQIGAANAQSQSISPYLSMLLGNKRKENNMV